MDVDEKVTDKRSELLTKSGIKHKKLVGPQITDEFPHLHEYDDKWSGIYEPTGTALLADKCLTSIQVKNLHKKISKIKQNYQNFKKKKKNSKNFNKNIL